MQKSSVPGRPERDKTQRLTAQHGGSMKRKGAHGTRLGPAPSQGLDQSGPRVLRESLVFVPLQMVNTKEGDMLSFEQTPRAEL